MTFLLGPIRRLIVVVCLALLGSVTAARAQSCTFTPTDVVFGAVDVLGGGATDGVGNIAIRCPSFLGLVSSVQMSIHLGEGLGGRSNNLRRMGSTTTSTGLAYDLYQDAGRSTVFGGIYGTYGGQPRSFTEESLLSLLTTTGINVPVYGRVLGGQSAVAPGTYQSTFSRDPFDVRVDYRTCPLLGTLCTPRTATFSFNVRAQVQPNCRVVANDLDFGTHGFLDQAVNASSEIRVTCTAGTSHSLGIGYGLQGTGLVDRYMRDLAGNRVRYELFRNEGRTQPWGLVTDGNAAVSAGTGSTRPLTVYGRVPAQVTPMPGNYTDTVVVTVTY